MKNVYIAFYHLSKHKLFKDRQIYTGRNEKSLGSYEICFLW